MSCVMLDYSAFPHIVDAIVEYATVSPQTYMRLRSVCRTFRNKIDARLHHVLVHPSTTTHSCAELVTPWQYAEGGRPLGITYHSFNSLTNRESTARRKLFASTKVVDVQSASYHLVSNVGSGWFLADLLVNRLRETKKVILRRIMTETNKPASMPVPIAPRNSWGPNIAIDFLALHPRKCDRSPEVMVPDAPVCRNRIIHITYDENDPCTRLSTICLRNSDYAAAYDPPINITIIFSPYPCSPMGNSTYIQGGTLHGPCGGLFHGIARDMVSLARVKTSWTIVGIENISRRNLCLEGVDPIHAVSPASKQDQLRNVIWGLLPDLGYVHKRRFLSRVTFLTHEEYKGRIGVMLYDLATRCAPPMSSRMGSLGECKMGCKEE